MTSTINFNGLTGQKLVAAYNEMLAQAVKHAVPGFKDARQVTRFATTEAGIKRCEKLQEALQAAGTPAAAPADETVTETVTTTFPETSVEDTNHTEDEDAEALLPGETEEEYMARKAKKKVAGAAKKGGKGKARSTGGTTIREMTDEYNAIVKGLNQAQKEAAPFAKHHSSNFESKEKAKKQLDRLKKAVAKA